jgi:hypothetical protein
MANWGLHLPALDLEHFFKLFAPQGAEDYELVQSVDELRRKLVSRRFDCRASQFFIDVARDRLGCTNETHTPGH